MAGIEIDRLAGILSKLPGLGPRSARRLVLKLLTNKDLLNKLMLSLNEVQEKSRQCSTCGNIDIIDPCTICSSSRHDGVLVVVESVADLWALERSARLGRYHVLGGLLSVIDGIGPKDLRMEQLVVRAQKPGVHEVILALSMTVDGQTTSHYIANLLAGSGVKITRLARGVPIGGELDYLDEGTIGAALAQRVEL